MIVRKLSDGNNVQHDVHEVQDGGPQPGQPGHLQGADVRVHHFDQSW